MANESKKRKSLAEINVVPYIDVMLVLLIVFMVAAPLLTQGVQVDLPQAPSTPLDNDDQEPLVVSVKADGSYYATLGNDEQQAKSLDDIQTQVGKVLKAQPQTPVLVWGDTNVVYGKVIELMTALQAVGADSVGLVTEPPG